jgi:phage/plasmid primase-like uncharacterized protein
VNAQHEIRSALAHVPPTDRDTWLRMGMAVKSELGEDGFELWDEWSQRDDSYNPRDARSVWRSISPNGKVTAGTLFYEAARHGFAPSGTHRHVVAPTAEEIARREQANKEAEQKAAKEHAAAAVLALHVWKSAIPARSNHPYLERKRIVPVMTLRELPAKVLANAIGYAPKQRDDALTGRVLLASIRVGESLSSLEFIDEIGRKSALAGGAKLGGFWSAQTLPDGDGRGKTLLLAEGVATTISLRLASELPAFAALSCGNLEKAARALNARYPRARIIVCGDLGNGERQAHDAARAVGGLVALPDFGADRPDGGDFNDMAQLANGRDAIKRAIAAASEPNPSADQTVTASAPAAQDAKSQGDSGDSGDSSRQSTNSGRRGGGDSGRLLDPSQIEAAMQRARCAVVGADFETQPYPVHALGPLAGPCAAIAELGQVAPDVVGQCLLTTAALLTQSHASVRTLAGVKPLSLYALSICDSGDGKSTAERVALASVHTWQRERATAYQQHLQAAASASRGKDEAKTEPREPYIIMRDGTVEGIRRAFRQGLPAQGVFTSEAAMLLSGYGMNPDNRAKSAGNFNSLWDDGEISVARGTDGRVQLYDRRLSLHWLIQPDVARAALYDQLLSSMGFWPRFLATWSPSSKPRLARPFHPERDSRIGAYWTRCAELLSAGQPEDCRELPIIAASDEAQRFAGQFFERMEANAKTPGAILEHVKPFAVRATEQLFRIAGVLAKFGGNTEIDLDAIRNAAALAAHSLETWRAIHGDRDEAEGKSRAMALYGWLLKQPYQAATATSILHVATPKTLRSKGVRDRALAQLEHAGLAARRQETWAATLGSDG